MDGLNSAIFHTVNKEPKNDWTLKKGKQNMKKRSFILFGKTNKKKTFEIGLVQNNYTIGSYKNSNTMKK